MCRETEITAFAEYLRNIERSENTVTVYTKTLELYFSVYRDITKENLLRFKKEQQQTMAPRTAALRIAALNSYCDYIGRGEFKLKQIKIQNVGTIENVIKLNDYLYFVENLKKDGHEKVYFMVKFLAMSGCRISELISLEKDDLPNKEFVLYSKGKVRRILIPDKLLYESKTYFESITNSPYLFPNKHGEKMTAKGAASLIRYYGIRYGIDEKVLHPHSFRHMFAIQFLKENKNLPLLADILGHENLNTTAIYLRLSKEEQHNQLNNTITW